MAEDFRVLRLFNQKVEKLERLRFLVDPPQIGAIVEWRRSIGWEGIHVGPDDKSIDATVLSLRFFLQDNESTSLFKMSAKYQNLDVSEILISEFLRRRQEVNKYLDSPSHLAISDERQMTHREILGMFLWGDLAHANPHQEATYRDVSATPFFPLFQYDFVMTIRCFIRALQALRDVNLRTIAELEAKGR